MTGLTPYLHFPGTARGALSFSREVFGGELVLHTLAEFGRSDGPADAIAHGMLQGPVELFAADAGEACRRGPVCVGTGVPLKVRATNPRPPIPDRAAQTMALAARFSI